MTDENAIKAEQIQLRERALARWENEGGAEPERMPQSALPVPELSNTELVQLRVRVIALENVVIALLADGSEIQLAHVREMAAIIAPRLGRTQHPLTVDAASHMLSLLHRAGHFSTPHDGDQ